MSGNRLFDDDSKKLFIPRCVISGGQTGVDRAALDVALAMGLEQSGWCPKGRGAEDGRIPDHYHMIEVDSFDYRVRTEENIRQSDATLILYEGTLSGGTALTRRLVRELNKPNLCERIHRPKIEHIQAWLAKVRPDVLNVAGPRESNYPGIMHRAMSVLLRVFGERG
jgi:hypothetical protein